MPDQDKIPIVLSALKEFLLEQEIVETPAEARLLLAFYCYDSSILENNSVSDINNKDVWTVQQKLDWLNKRAKAKK